MLRASQAEPRAEHLTIVSFVLVVMFCHHPQPSCPSCSVVDSKERGCESTSDSSSTASNCSKRRKVSWLFFPPSLDDNVVRLMSAPSHRLFSVSPAELAQKARKEIADYLSAGKDERARIRVEHIIREDYLVEAMEILELYCDLLLARFGLIQSMK